MRFEVHFNVVYPILLKYYFVTFCLDLLDTHHHGEELDWPTNTLSASDLLSLFFKSLCVEACLSVGDHDTSATACTSWVSHRLMNQNESERTKSPSSFSYIFSWVSRVVSVRASFLPSVFLSTALSQAPTNTEIQESSKGNNVRYARHVNPVVRLSASA